MSAPRARGKFLWAGDRKLYVRGVTYGTFAPNENEELYPEPELVELDFARMTENGINAIRTYDVPPSWLLDAAHRFGLKVMVGLAWEQHVAFLDDRRRRRAIEERVRAGVRACREHPAVLCYAIGNEIPASIVRWHGSARIERFLERLYRAAKREDPEALVTYVNYPSTEYLDLPFLDLLCFNVFLESEERLDAYLARLQNLAADRPLLITEVGLDSRRNGLDAQAASIAWQVRTVFQAGCGGAFVFSWCDDWHRGGAAVVDWDFGMVARDRTAKPALEALRAAYAKVPFAGEAARPSMSVIVCSHNGAATLERCLEGVTALDYPDYEVLVVDDGSSDRTAAIAAGFGVRVIRTPQVGLSNARNIGLRAAAGEIVAYLDDDAWPDPDWLSYLAASFATSSHVGMGGPNIPPPGQGTVAECVARAPGGPIHVLVSDREAEHIPGCNMAFRKEALEAIGGFDPQFRTAGDDVDICWRLNAMGWTLGFSPGAMVWHLRRKSLRSYLRQQAGYGKAEALLERKWPERYNAGGHLNWSGHVYSDNRRRRRDYSWHVYYGTWGSSLFQSVYARPSTFLASIPLLPEWYLLIAATALMTTLGLVWPPLLFRLPWLGLPLASVLLAASIGVLLVPAARAGWNAFPTADLTSAHRHRDRMLIGVLNFLQPIARLWGRLRHGLTPWRRGNRLSLSLPVPRMRTIWNETWQPASAWLGWIERDGRRRGAAIRRGGAFDRWDLEVRAGSIAGGRLRLAVEEHGRGRQLIRIRVWPSASAAGLALPIALGTGLVIALVFHAPLALWRDLAAAAAPAGLWMAGEAANGVGTLLRSVDELSLAVASGPVGEPGSRPAIATPKTSVPLALHVAPPAIPAPVAEPAGALQGGSGGAGA